MAPDHVRAEISELLTLTRAARDATVSPLVGLDQVPLMAHARYTRAEVFAAMGVSAIDKPKEHREGVYFASDLRTQLMFVTLNKDDASFASHIQYKDHAVSADLFHWESPNSWRQHTKAMLRCIGNGPEASDTSPALRTRAKQRGRRGNVPLLWSGRSVTASSRAIVLWHSPGGCGNRCRMILEATSLLAAG